MRLALALASSLFLVVTIVGCGESVPATPSSSSTPAAGPAADAAPAKSNKKGAAPVAKQTFEKRRAYSAVDAEGPPSKY